MSFPILRDGYPFALTLRGTIVLPVTLPELPPAIEIKGESLLVKSAFHVSVVCPGEMVRKYQLDIPDFVDRVVKDFSQFIETHRVSVVRYTDEFRFAVQDDLRTLILMCEVSEINEFFDQLNQMYHLNVEYPPMHVTLYTKQQDKGIFVIDSDDREKRTTVIERPAALRDILFTV